MTLRRFSDADLVEVRELIHRTIGVCYPAVYPQRAVDYFRRFHADDAILARATDGLVVVIEEAAAIVATGAVVRGEVTGVFVAPERQGSGLGSAVMDELEAQARAGGNGVARLSVSLPSRAFYERRGYRMVERRSLDVGEGERLDYWEAVKEIIGES